MSNVEEKTEKLLTKVINDLGYELYDLEYVKEGKDYFLRIYIDSQKGINLNDCEKVTNSITKLLDEKDYIKEQYFLEISSPGIERTLRKEKHLKDNIGREIQIKFFSKIDGKKLCQGILKNYTNDYIVVLFDNKEMKIDRKDIAQIKTVYNW